MARPRRRCTSSIVKLKPGALEGIYNIEQLETADAFAFVLEGLLGHAIYL